MEKHFQCTRTISQQEKNGFVETQVYGRPVKDINVGDKLSAPIGVYTYSCKVVSITAYGKPLDKIDGGITCILTVHGNDYLDNIIEFLGN